MGLSDDLHRLVFDAGNLEQERDDLLTKIEDLVAQIADVQGENESLGSSIGELEDQKAALHKEVQELAVKNDTLEGTLEKFVDDERTYLEQIAAFKDRVAAFEGEYEGRS